MKYILEPCMEVGVELNLVLKDLGLERKEYSVIHIRSGDNYLSCKSNEFKQNYIQRLLAAIEKYVSVEKKYLLISDNNLIKKMVVNRFPQFKCLIADITHFGEGVVLEEAKVKNTMIDFYLLSLSREIFSFSAYKHGSGFSYWCAKTYDIPYVCKYICDAK